MIMSLLYETMPMKFRIYKTIKDNEVVYIPKYKKWCGWSYITCSNGIVDKKVYTLNCMIMYVKPQ